MELSNDYKRNIFLIIIGCIVFVISFYFFKNYFFSPRFFNFSARGECLKAVSKMTDKELVGQLSEGALNKAVGTKILAEKQLLRYLICRVGENKSWELYNLSKNYIESNIINTRDKEGALLWLNKEMYSSSSPNFFKLFALMPVDKICSKGEESKQLLEKCLNGGNLKPENIKLLSPREVKRDRKLCHQFCEDLGYYMKNPTIFENEIRSFNWYKNPKLLYYQYKVPIAIAFRIGGKDFAVKICGFVPNAEIGERCLKDVQYLVINSPKCADYRRNLANLMCGSSL